MVTFNKTTKKKPPLFNFDAKGKPIKPDPVTVKTITGEPPSSTSKTSTRYRGDQTSPIVIHPDKVISNQRQLDKLRKARGKVIDRDKLELARTRAKKAEATQPAGLTAAGQYVYPTEAAEREAEVAAAREKEGVAFLEEEGFYEEERPREVDLSTYEREREYKTPVLGASFTALTGEELEKFFTRMTGHTLKRQWVNAQTDEEFRTLIQNPEAMKEVAMQEIQKEVITEGLSASENFGAMVEAVPIFGSLAREYAGGMIEDPAGNVDTMVEEIALMGSIASNMREKSAKGVMGDPYEVYATLGGMELDITEMLSRIQQLINSSSTLQANTDGVNKIKRKILETQQRIFDAKQSAAYGIVKTPTDASIYNTLFNVKSKAELDIRHQEILKTKAERTAATTETDKARERERRKVEIALEE